MKFEITSVNHLSSEDRFKVIGSETKPLESIIERLSNEAAQNRRYNADVQQIVRINDRTGEVFTRFFILGADIAYYLVSNTNLVRRALHKSPKFIVQDHRGRKIEFHVECEISCPPGNETIVAQALHSTETPAVKFNRFIEQCIDKFRDNDEHFIDNFFTSNLFNQIENVIAGRNPQSTVASATYIMGLKCYAVRCVWNEPEWETISIDIENFDVPFKNSVERHQTICKCTLAVDDKNRTNALSSSLAKADFERIFKGAIQDIYGNFVSEDDVFEDFEAVKNTLNTRLGELLQKYGWRIAGLELRDLVLERCLFLQNIDIDLKEMKFFAADRKFVEIRELLVTAKLENPKAAKPYKDNPEGLKNRLKEVVEAVISEFVSKIDSGEFYIKIEKPNTEFRNRLIESIVVKTRQIINAGIILRKIDTETEREIRSLDEMRKCWTPFSTHIVSKGECLVQGSFIVSADNPEKREMRERQVLNSEVIKNKIVETLKAWLVKYSAAAIIFANRREPEKFEQAIKNLLLNKVDEAHGVFINLQNITTEIIDHSTAEQEALKSIELLQKQIVTGLTDGVGPERIDELKGRIRAIEIVIEEEYEKKLGQSGNSSGQTSDPSDLEEHNPLLKEVNRLLLEGNTSEGVPA
jgi:hypothetical protein